ncbi:MAG: hypothetical protein KUG76_03860 [Gammaproteobacteria bacterium]|nr:hypothetical protein [Gammaproteobacteria bacterium]
MDEQTRVAYLDRIGIPVWFATNPLEGALPTPVMMLKAQLEVPACDDASRQQENHPHPFIGPASVTRDEKLISEPRLLDAHTEGRVDIPVEEASRALKALPLHISFAKICVKGGVLILAELGDDRAPGFSAAESRLLRGILNAINWSPSSQGSLDSQVARWPQSKGNNLPTDTKAAGEFLHAYLDAQAQRSNFEVLLLLGDKLEEAYAFSEEDQGPKLTGHRKITGSSLLGMLQMPSKKAELWNNVKHLAKYGHTD